MPQKVQAIAGVLASGEAEIHVRYPSAAASSLGRLIGNICELLPIRIWGVKLSYLLFAPLVAPLALLVYFGQKAFGERYVLTNRSIQRWTLLAPRLLQTVSLTDIADVVVQLQPGQEFYHAADLYLLNAKGDPMMVLPGVSRPDIFRQSIIETRDARVLVEQSLKTIQARQPAAV